MSEKKLLSSEAQELELAIKHLNQGEYEVATGEFKKVLLSSPKNELAHVKLGHAYLQQKDFPQATRHFNATLAINPRNTEAIFGLGFYYFEQGGIDAAIAKFTQVISLEPDNPHAHFGLGLCYLGQGRFDQAIEEFGRVFTINPQHPQVHYHLGLCYYRKGDFSQSISQFNKAVAVNPDNWLGHAGLAQIYLEQDDLLSCQKEADAIKRLSPGLDESYHRLLSQLYIKQKQYDSATEELQKIRVDCATEKGIGPGAIEDNLSSAHKHAAVKILRIPNFYGSEIISTELNSILLPPLALGSIVSYLKAQGIDIDQDDLHIKIHYDNYFSQDPKEKVDEGLFFDEARVLEYARGKEDPEIDEAMERVGRKTVLGGYRVILFSLDSCSMNFSHAMFSLCLARYLKKKHKPLIVLGGLTYFPELMQKIGHAWPDVDYVVCKEGEETLAELLSFLLAPHSQEHGADTRFRQRVLCADKVPPSVRPDYEGLPLDKYKYRGLKTEYCQNRRLREVISEFNGSRTLILPIRFIKGCTNRCIFCASSSGGLIHVVSPGEVTDWLKELQGKYNPTGYLFLNDTLNISNSYLAQLCAEIIKKQVKILWSDCVRVDRLDKDVIYKMREAGCIRMVFGMETASKRLLAYINKDIDLAQLEKMLFWADKAGIWTGIELISGLPHEGEEDIKDTVSFIKKNRSHIDAIYYNAFNIKDTSMLRMHPERYGINNIFEISTYPEGFSTFVKYGFDEIGGLKWPEKIKQIMSTFRRVIKELGEIPFAEHEYEHFLFFLYSRYSDKKTIKRLFYSVGAEKIKHLAELRKQRAAEQFLSQNTEKILAYG